MVKVHFFGHSFFKLEFAGATVLIDPFIYCSGDVQRIEPCHHSVKRIKNVDAILVTHEHFDHFDHKAIEGFCEKENCYVISHDSILNELNIPKNLKRSISKGGSISIKGVEIKAVSVHHPHSFYPLGFYIESEGVSVFHAGDTDLVPTLNNVKCNIALLPIGGYNTMDVIDAVKLVKNTKPDVVIPMSYNTFEFLKASPAEFSEKIQKSILKTKPVIMKPGEIFDYNP